MASLTDKDPDSVSWFRLFASIAAFLRGFPSRPRTCRDISDVKDDYMFHRMITLVLLLAAACDTSPKVAATSLAGPTACEGMTCGSGFGAHENWPTRAYLKWSTSPFRIASTIGSATNLR